ncbi:peptidase inhibitor family I36 protein [Allokutzneria sp. NRRL B-24872]|uniref:peptidase inhibitor family I36 protein n=1 Tax=Allokutzneria sp. NRRL B-24872 TaxID=1137961 RepID=UPI000A38AE73|nr:peptidase inhibitor family I36 protein [Allokutzneria sp. NRRL B-24872]
MRKTIQILGLSAVLMAGVITPVEAASAFCPTNYVCMWEDAGYRGTRYVAVPGVKGFHDIDGWDGDNEISSVINRSQCTARLHSDDDYSWPYWWVYKNQSVPDLKSLKTMDGDIANDDVESFQLLYC